VRHKQSLITLYITSHFSSAGELLSRGQGREKGRKFLRRATKADLVLFVVLTNFCRCVYTEPPNLFISVITAVQGDNLVGQATRFSRYTSVAKS
jgi:hypothetical protein